MEYVFEYVAISTAYLAHSLPILELIFEVRSPNWLRVALWLLPLGIVPASLGILLGAANQRGWWRGLMGKIGLFLVSPYPTGWDWMFARLRTPVFLLVTLDDDSIVAGYFGLDSLASSDPAERDLFIEEAYDVDDKGTWTRRPEKQGILIAGKSVKHIEIWRAPTAEATND